MLIGIIGKKESGKTTAANILKEILEPCDLLAFGDALKEMIIKAGICTYDEVYVQKTEYSRTIMQKIGTEIFRNQVDYNYWVKELDKKMISLPKKNNIIIHDVRFLNEAEYVSWLGGYLFRVIRHEKDQDNDAHVSETLQDSIVSDINIFNDGSLEELKEKLKMAIDYFLKERSII